MDFTNSTSTVRYIGFSTAAFEETGSFQITDIDVIRTDILNHIFTSLGERVNQPEFGTLIPDLPFEFIDDELLDTIKEELRRVFDYDPRVELRRIQLVPDYDSNTVTVYTDVNYIELNVDGNLNFNIELGQG